MSFIELQPSRRSTQEEISFVINFGVIVPSLFVGDDLTKAEYGGWHWGGRVSGKDSVEIWWPVRARDDVEELAARVTMLLKQEVLPALDGKQREDDIVALWKSGRSPLVDSQRLLYLGTLLHRAGRRDEFEQTMAELERQGEGSLLAPSVGEAQGTGGLIVVVDVNRREQQDFYAQQRRALEVANVRGRLMYSCPPTTSCAAARVSSSPTARGPREWLRGRRKLTASPSPGNGGTNAGT